MTLKRIFADFNNADYKGRVRLNSQGTVEDITKSNILLTNGVEILLTDYDSLQTIGIVEFSEDEQIWVARINWDSFK
jgi:hypothetical protein